MKKFISMLSLAAIVASALFVSCAQPKEPTLVPAFPYNKTATYAQNEDSGVWAWSYNSADEFTNALGVGFQDSKINPLYLEYRMTPNADWTLEIVGNGKEYVEVYRQNGYFEESECTFSSVLSGVKGLNAVGFRVIKTPAIGEDVVTVELKLSMAGESMVILTFVIEPALM